MEKALKGGDLENLSKKLFVTQRTAREMSWRSLASNLYTSKLVSSSCRGASCSNLVQIMHGMIQRSRAISRTEREGAFWRHYLSRCIQRRHDRLDMAWLVFSRWRSVLWPSAAFRPQGASGILPRRRQHNDDDDGDEDDDNDEHSGSE